MANADQTALAKVENDGVAPGEAESNSISQAVNGESDDSTPQVSNGNLGHGAANGGFTNMNFNNPAEYNQQMQMMMAMNNGMASNPFGTFSMMSRSPCQFCSFLRPPC